MVPNSNNKKPATQAVKEFLAFLVSEHPKIQKIVIALSGGMDSTCLLHALSNACKKHQLIAVYVDHGLQAESIEWARVNEYLCQDLSIEFHSVTVQINKNEASLEQAARNARYEALSQFIDAKSCLVTAQHQHDQAETLLLQMFRGSGAKGLAAMPFIKTFAQGFHARPLLKTSRVDIESYVRANGLEYIEDPSNNDLAIRRNFLRKKIVPKLKKYWPQINQSLYKVSTNLAESQDLLEEVAAEDLKLFSEHNALDIDKLKEFSKARQANLFRYWLDKFDFRMPSKEFLNEILEQLLNATSDSDPIIELEDSQIRRHQNRIYIIKSAGALIDTEQSWQWKLSKDFVQDNVVINVEEVLRGWPHLKNKQVTVRYRKAGDKFYQNKDAQGKSLKNYFQENKVATWLRQECLLVEHQGKVIFIRQKTS